MSVPRVPDPAMLVVSVLAPEEGALYGVEQPAVRELGPIWEKIGPLAFGFSSYYEAELGPGLRRWLWVFADLVDRGALASIKILTNQWEQSYMLEGKRKFNLDPGLITLGNFVLATGKNNAHRIYLAEGIFADLTLIFRSGSYRPLEWTYPDYADAELTGILNRLREKYKCRLAQLNE